MSELRTRISPLLEPALERYAAALRARYGKAVLQIRLFGSWPRREAHEESDVDVAVVLAEVDWDTRRDVIDMAADIGLELDLFISPTLFDRRTFEKWRAQERALVMDIEREGVPL